MPVLEAQELYRFFHSGEEEVKALRGVSLSLERGELVALMGPSGSGKSTLLHCLAGLDEPDGGYVWVQSHAMSRQPEVVRAQLRASQIGLMLQKNNLFEHLSVAENLGFVQKSTGNGLPAPHDILEKLGIVARMSFLPQELSGGERARAALAMALASDPEVLLLDEPTAEVDRSTEDQMIAMLRYLCASGKSIIAATHNPALVNAADRILRLRDGKMTDES